MHLSLTHELSIFEQALIRVRNRKQCRWLSHFENCKIKRHSSECLLNGWDGRIRTSEMAGPKPAALPLGDVPIFNYQQYLFYPLKIKCQYLFLLFRIFYLISLKNSLEINCEYLLFSLAEIKILSFPFESWTTEIIPEISPIGNFLILAVNFTYGISFP